MAEPIIEVKGITKEYVLAHQLPYVTIRDTIVEAVKKPFRMFGARTKTSHERFMALNGVSFDVHRGEAIGLIGANGSGKSTLLKILSQITNPSSGEIHLRGRVASLLEVGTGFHPELTGRENIFLNGAILGMTRKEINQKFEAIVKFSGVEKFLDTPVKRYSSGMHVRLAFSVAAHLEPEILLVDEVLAVGDEEFQKKCLGKMDEVTKTAGRTIIFVSHNMEAIKKLCTRCILLRDGQVVMFDATEKVVQAYLNPTQHTKVSVADRRDRDGQGGIKFTNLNIENAVGGNIIRSGDQLRFTLDYRSNFPNPINDARVVITVVNDDLRPVLRLDSDVTASSLGQTVIQSGTIVCETGAAHLIEGRYFVEIDFLIKGTSQDHVLMAGEFEVSPNLDGYNFRAKADGSITSTLIQYQFKQ